uniref:Mitogen-activated protein kinase n=1 Tax=Glossina brevipalpis TaxID=37001 RepID=A0A1A9W790_9MUSC
MTTKSKAQEKQRISEIDENISKIFDIRKRLGKGAYGIVWKALDKRTNETLAVKKIFDAFRDETDAQRTFREIIFLKAFRTHPSIVKLHNVYKASNNLDIYLIFEYVESDLHNIIKKGTILKDIHKRYVMYQLINAIKYIHSGNVIHRDLKPSNVLIDSKCRSKSTLMCKLADFGLARSVSNRPVRDNNDMGSDMPMEPLLTDYVATRWYRAPEILVASKRYTKGIDMWSLGCILGEMIRGKPLFQGSSTVNQIEKIILALPDITEHDINAVGAGFGSVLLSKQISRDKKTSLNYLLADATRDALDMVKSLLVLNPLGRLTAKQALNHPYVEKFRNSIPELELNVDILPPFRDDVRLTVSEYRSKLYEIVQPPCDKNSDMRASDTSKQREPKLRHGHERSDTKKSTKLSKQSLTLEEKYIIKDKLIIKPEKHEFETPQNSGGLNNIINRALKKSNVSLSPIPKKKHSKTTLKPIGLESGDVKYMENSVEEKNIIRCKSHGHRPPKGSENTAARNTGDVKRHSVDAADIPKKPESGHKLQRSSTTLHSRVERTMRVLNTDLMAREDRPNRFIALPGNSTTASKSNASLSTVNVRSTKSEVMAAKNDIEHAKKQERICYERRLKKLEEEIDRYKKEVKSFCRDSFNFSNRKSHHRKTSQEFLLKQPLIFEKSAARAIPNNSFATTNLPIKTTYFHLLTKGNRNDDNKFDFDFSANSGTGSSSDHFGRYKPKCCSGREKEFLNQSQQLPPNQHRSKPISKFI